MSETLDNARKLAEEASVEEKRPCCVVRTVFGHGWDYESDALFPEGWPGGVYEIIETYRDGKLVSNN